jgi:hypothetical protein
MFHTTLIGVAVTVADKRPVGSTAVADCAPQPPPSHNQVGKCTTASAGLISGTGFANVNDATAWLANWAPE